MALTADRTSMIVEKYGENKKDTGSVKVQVALLTERIKELTEHTKVNKKDMSAKRSLLKLVGQRRRLLRYYERRDLEGYRAFIKEIGLRK